MLICVSVRKPSDRICCGRVTKRKVGRGVITMAHKMRALLCGVPKYIAKLTLNMSLPLTSITCFAMLPIWAILLPMPTLLLLKTVIVTFESLGTILSRGGAHIPPPITSSPDSLKGRTVAIKHKK